MMMHMPFDNSYARLPPSFYAKVRPSAASAPKLVKLNSELALLLGFDPDALAGEAGAEIFAGRHILEGADPIATAYAGHQFGHFVPQLGDGRAILLGEVVGRDGERRDLQLKGSGRTPFSRQGDGRAVLGPVLREYIVSEAMAALGIPSTRALAIVTTGETVRREGLMPGAILTRVAASHIRVGTFQFFASRGDLDGLRRLADYAIERHYPDAAEAEQPYCALLEAAAGRQANLVAQWLLVGFVHGVMNTDNMSIAGETIDFGPCAFLDVYDPATVFSSIDETGRYAYANQPLIAQWNLARLAECLLTLTPDDEKALERMNAIIESVSTRFNAAYLGGLRNKLGLMTAQDEDLALAQDLLTRMRENLADFTLTFRRLCGAAGDSQDDTDVRNLFADPAAYDDWAARWRRRMQDEDTPVAQRQAAMRAANPLFIPRNHRVEAVIAAAVEREDFAPFEELLKVLSAPYDDQPAYAAYADPPAERIRYRTFCGT